MIVLFHVTADTSWSDLPLSGAFVDMLKRIVGIVRRGRRRPRPTPRPAPQSTARDAVPPTRVLDGFGAFEPPPPTARPIPAGYAGRATADNPPGFYGPPEGLVAVNTLAPADRLAPIDFEPLNPRIEYFRTSRAAGPARTGLPRRAAAAADRRAGGVLARRRHLPAAAAARHRGRHAGRRRRRPCARAGARRLAAPLRPTPAADQFAAHATRRDPPRLCGDRRRRGRRRQQVRPCRALTTFLAQRTALEAGDPIGVDIDRDELAFFPLIYWPIVPGAKKPTPQALARIDAYMKQGGTVLFDTRDAVLAPPGPGGEARSPGMVELRSILSSLDIPELEPVPKDHVLTKTFFLLRDFPGPLHLRASSGSRRCKAPTRRRTRTRPSARRAAATACPRSSSRRTISPAPGRRGPDGQPMLPLVPGEPRQREFAFRAGVNIVMYTLTGNYKADQVHIPALLERLGQ